MICFRDKMHKNLVCVLTAHTSIQRIMFLSAPIDLHIFCVKCAGVWDKITPLKWAVLIKLYPISKPVYIHVTLKDFTPDLQKIYTDISAISVTLCNSLSSQTTNRDVKINVKPDYQYGQYQQRFPTSMGPTPGQVFFASESLLAVTLLTNTESVI